MPPEPARTDVIVSLFATGSAPVPGSLAAGKLRQVVGGNIIEEDLSGATVVAGNPATFKKKVVPGWRPTQRRSGAPAGPELIV